MSHSSDRLGRRGIAAIEFAIVAPMLLLLLLASSDIVIWMRTWLEVQQSVTHVTQMIAQYKTFYTSDFTNVFLPIAATGLDSGAVACSSGAMIVTGIDNPAGTPKVEWQWKSGTCATSNFTKTSGSTVTPMLPGNYAPPMGLSVILVEMATTHSAFVFSAGLMGTSGGTAVSTYALVMPRTGSLPTFTSGTRPANS